MEYPYQNPASNIHVEMHSDSYNSGGIARAQERAQSRDRNVDDALNRRDVDNPFAPSVANVQ